MLIAELTYHKPIEEVDKFLVEHRAFLDKYYEKGILIASGPKEPRVGGVILGVTDKETMESILQEDPFYQNGIATYQLTEFHAVKFCEQLKCFFE